jgi:hypothetical protein
LAIRSRLLLSEVREQDARAGEVDEAQEDFDMILPSGDEATEAVYPREESLYFPASAVAAQPAPVLAFASVAPVGREPYPGMYVPRPIEFTLSQSKTPLEQLSREMLSLSKLNWNNTQFVGGGPITLRTARRVGVILKCVPDGGVIQPSYRFYI